MRRALPVLLLAACSPDAATVGTFSLSWTADPPAFTVKASDGRELLRSAGPFVDVREAEPEWEMQYGSFRVIEPDATWHPATGITVQQADPGHVVLSMAQDGGETTLDATSTTDGQLDLVLKATGSVNRVRATFACAPADHFLGFGSQADATDHHGHKLAVWVSEPGIGKTDLDVSPPDDTLWFLAGTRHAASYPLPTFLSGRGFAFLADTTRRAVFDLCQADENAWSVETWDKEVKLSVFDGPAPAKAVERLTSVIGRQPLANDLALAPWNDAIFGDAKVREIADLLREKHIPSGAIWTEDFRGGTQDGPNYRLREEWDVDPTLYPDIQGLSKSLHDKGFRFFAYHNTFLVTGTDIIAAARAKDVLVKRDDGSEYLFPGVTFVKTGLVDLSAQAGRRFVTDALVRYLGAGFDGWMADYAEWLPADAKLADGRSGEVAHNEYTRDYHAAVAEALKTRADQATCTSFSRSGTLRTAPFQPVVWAGDQSTDFAKDDGLPTVVTMGINMGLGGISTFGSDIGGYQNATLPPSTKETFFRWTTVGALSPVMRTHHGTKARENWWFGKDEETVAHFRRWAMFHAQLWPYLSLAARTAHDTGLPIMRHLALAFPDDARVWTIADEYLFGPSLLVAPVLVQGALKRRVTLPAGKWMPFFGGVAVDGGGEGDVDVPITEAAIFVRPGTIIPMLTPDFDSLMPAEPPLRDLDDVRGKRALQVFLGADGAATDLDGTTYAITHISGSEPTVVKADGAELAPCPADGACFERDLKARSIVVRGKGLKTVDLAASATNVAKVVVTGALSVDEMTVRY